MAKRTKPPSFYTQYFSCKHIEEITRSDHNSFYVKVLRITDEEEYTTLDCKTILNIRIGQAPYYENQLIIQYEEYFTEEKIAELQDRFIRGEYDDLGILPGF